MDVEAALQPWVAQISLSLPDSLKEPVDFETLKCQLNNL